MENTCRDFWKMVYERDCSSIVMLSGIIENDLVSQCVWGTIYTTCTRKKSYIIHCTCWICSKRGPNFKIYFQVKLYFSFYSFCVPASIWKHFGSWFLCQLAQKFWTKVLPESHELPIIAHFSPYYIIICRRCVIVTGLSMAYSSMGNSLWVWWRRACMRDTSRGCSVSQTQRYNYRATCITCTCTTMHGKRPNVV